MTRAETDFNAKKRQKRQPRRFDCGVDCGVAVIVGWLLLLMVNITALSDPVGITWSRKMSLVSKRMNGS